jgi:hexosaminidase
MAMENRYDHFIKAGDKTKAEEFRLIDPDDQSTYLSAQSFKDNIANVAQPSVYHFYETVVKDFIAMYDEAGLKMTVFNTGGDEVANGAWAKSPLCAELMKTLPDIQNPRQLHGYFVGKTIDMLEKYQLQLTGWEEMVLNKDSTDEVTINTKYVGKNVMPLVWDNADNNIDLGYRIANAGYPVVLCNVTNLYFDLAYNTDPFEPGLHWGGFQDDIDPYVMTPFNVFNCANYDWFGRMTKTDYPSEGREQLKPENRKNIVGLQAQIWSETLRETGMIEYYMVPKLFSFAEKAWAKEASWEDEADVSKRVNAIMKSWSEFTNRIGQRELPKLDAVFGDYNYRIAPPGAIVEDGILKANTAYPGLIIRYTTDGSEPTIASTLYSGPVTVEGIVKIRAFNQKGRGSKTFIVFP